MSIEFDVLKFILPLLSSILKLPGFQGAYMGPDLRLRLGWT